jgi:hypothetical protein
VLELFHSSLLSQQRYFSRYQKVWINHQFSVYLILYLELILTLS